MPVDRVFLGWDRPGLLGAVDYLIERFGSTGELDLANVLVVVPGSRAGRRLLELLVDRADQQRLVFAPPAIVTAGQFPERLYPAKRPPAGELVQRLVWAEALRRIGRGDLQQLLTSPPAEGDLLAWLSLGEMLSRVHRELAAEGRDFREVAQCCGQLGQRRELQRWQVLATVQQEYLETLDRMELWDIQTARREAVRRKECHSEAQIILLGTVDLNKTQCEMLDQLPAQVTALILAPPEWEDHFDPYGCLRPEKWQDATIPLSDEQLEVAEGPADQAAAVVRALAALEGRYSGEQITLGVPDSEVVPYLEQHLEQCAVPTRYAAGRPVAQTSPCRLLDMVAGYLEGRRFSSLAALVRHPAVQQWLVTEHSLPGDWLTELDRYYADHLPLRLGGSWLGDGHASARLKQVHEAIERLVRPLDGTRPLGDWAEPIANLLVTIFGRSPLDPGIEPDRTVLGACQKIHEVLREHLEIPEPLMPTTTGAEALRLVHRRAGSEAIAPPARRGAVELLGWLELPWDDAPVLIVTGFNEGIVPESIRADPFLPDQLRRALKLEDNQRRYARDAYALMVMLHSRPRVKLIAGRRRTEDEPLAPSRLLFACDEPSIARRVLACVAPERRPPTASIVPGVLLPGRETSCFPIPAPKPSSTPRDSMRVTEFRDYLACPYRYYLRHVLCLAGLDDKGDELDAARFGSLAHAALAQFGRSPAAASTDPAEIQACLDQALDHAVASQYGKAPLPAIRVQVEQLRQRLAAFARWQADWAKKGWHIEHVESQPEEGKAALVVDGQPMGLRGRIDRIDLNPATGQRIIIDYKLSDRAMPPERTHRQAGAWVDLQLPLYRHLAAAMGITGSVALGYVVLPKDTTAAGYLPSGWSEDDLKDADRTAEEVVRKVRAGVFWPPAKNPPPFFEQYAAICQDDQFGAVVAAEPQGGSSP